MPSKVYEAIAEDLTNLGGPMGSEYTTEKSLGLYSTLEAAKAKCERHYKLPLTWNKHNSTKDLGWVMFHIRERVVNA